jgi:hypothetical protein
MPYGPHNKQFDLTPRYPNMAIPEPALEETEPIEEAVRPSLPEAPGVSRLWVEAEEAARERYPRPQDYHETVRATAAQKAAKIPYLLLRANITADNNANKGLQEATTLLEQTNRENHTRSLITFLGHGVLPAYIQPKAVEIAVSAVQASHVAGEVDGLADAYAFWQQITGYTTLANMTKTE